MSLGETVEKYNEDCIIEFTIKRGRKFYKDKRFRVIQIVGDKVMSVNKNGRRFFNRMDFKPSVIEIEYLPF